MKRILLTFALFSSIVAGAQPRLNEKNIDQVVRAMTLREKAELLVGSIDGTNYTGIPMPTGNEAGTQRVPGAAGQTNTIPRLGIPSTVVADGPAGLRVMPRRPGDENTYYCTGFPVEILLASTWNTEVIREVGAAMGNDVREYGVDVILGPATNIMRSPLCGRNFEYFSEDPLLAGKMTAAITAGIQSQGVGTSVKHFAANNQETNRNANDSRVSARALREIYLKPFEITVREAQPWTIMSSYNQLNGEFTQESRTLLTNILRGDWGFEGLVMTDWTGQRNTSAQVRAGNDLMMPGVKGQIEQIVSDVQSGILSEKDVDQCVRRMLEYIVKTPSFKQYPYSNRPDASANARISRIAAEEGIVLLKNDRGALPLSDDIKNIAFFGVSSYQFIHDGFGSGHVNTPYVVNMLEGMASHGYGSNEKLRHYYESYIQSENAKFAFSPLSGIPLLETIGIGAHIEDQDLPSYAYATLAGESDLAVITLGRKPGEGFDRNVEGDFCLTAAEQGLLKGVCEAFHGAGKKVVVILNTGGVVETSSWKNLPDAIVLAWMPGQEGGNAVADILSGTVNPSGKLPVTFPCSYADVPGAEDFPFDRGKDYSDGMNGLMTLLRPVPADPNERNIGYTNYSEGIYVGYRHYTTREVPVSYPFGYGLSYTTFSYEKASVSRKGDCFTARITVTNTGLAAGKEVVQLYVSAPQGSLDKPVHELKAFAKTRNLKPGESQTLEMTFSTYDLASYDEALSAFVTDKGSYQAHFGTDANHFVETISFKVPSAKSYKTSRSYIK